MNSRRDFLKRATAATIVAMLPLLFGAVDSWECAINRKGEVQSFRLRPEKAAEGLTTEAEFEVKN